MSSCSLQPAPEGLQRHSFADVTVPGARAGPVMLITGLPSALLLVDQIPVPWASFGGCAGCALSTLCHA